MSALIEALDQGAESATVAGLRSANNRLLRQLDVAKATREELVDAVYRAARDAASALTLPPVTPPPSDRRRAKAEVAVVVLSDWQLGKRTPSYDSEVCAERIERLARKVVRLTEIQRSDHPVRDLHVFAVGDLVEGELIFGGQAHRIDASLYRQVTVDGPRILAGAIRHWLSAFHTVTVWSVDGNHGALGGPFRKEYHPESNADRMLYRIVQGLLEGEKRLTWNMPDPAGERNWYVVAEIGAYRSLLLHGDQFRGHSGIPWYGIQKKAGGWALGAIPEPFDDLDFGHFHQPTRLTLNRVTARCNGSTESHNTFAIEQMAAVGRPSQGLRFVEPEKGIVTAEYTIWLD
jgi:hypothetical protein